MDYITILEYIGVFAFAVSGAIVAIEEEFDVFGVYIIAIITAMGGGVLRDIVSDVGIPVFFTSYMTIPFIIAGTLLAIFLNLHQTFSCNVLEICLIILSRSF